MTDANISKIAREATTTDHVISSALVGASDLIARRV
jgi:hypothetical protein